MQKQFTGIPFVFSLAEFSGSLADLGVMSPLVLGVLLAYVGFQHMLLARDLRGAQAWLTALLVLVLTLWTNNLAVGFISAAVFYHLWNWLAGRFLSND